MCGTVSKYYRETFHHSIIELLKIKDKDENNKIKKDII